MQEEVNTTVTVQYSLEHITHTDEHKVHCNVLYASPDLILNTRTMFIRHILQQHLENSNMPFDSSKLFNKRGSYISNVLSGASAARANLMNDKECMPKH